eukprot:CAMPEP_0206233894 /NCGR_PEP_ID=MMETSP0047_2-20121206/12271_1 /ASSEMBLY_ACC=CAM_ASM_000192 /TAXON_ID=195065 /ORGANISM="Chroomonas mesostigmatica_cf, Strain CCMP1168" /LENGTH=165 /DNA_ID=CAMNT_0053657885 /DNA_START=200 /DNA_END=697 /DNA_ORIENTATION=+
MDFSGQNNNPQVFDTSANRRANLPLDEEDDSVEDALDALEIFDLIRDTLDPEHPLTLEALKVLDLKNVTVEGTRVHVFFTPTVPHCSASTLIGLCLRVKLQRSLPSHFKIDIEITPGTHLQEEQVNKQLADKERVAAALENDNLLAVVHKCLAGVEEGAGSAHGG